MLRSDIGLFLKSLRTDYIPKLFLKDLADEFGVTDSYISQIENGKKPPSEDILKKYTDKFSLTVSDLYIIKKSVNALGIELKKQRQKAGLDIGQIEDLTGIEFFRIAEIEQGDEDPSPDEVIKLCHALNLDPEHFENIEAVLFHQLKDVLKRLGLENTEIENIVGYTNKRLNKKLKK